MIRVSATIEMSVIWALSKILIVRSMFQKGKYFVWAGAHDLWHPSFVSAGVDALEREPDVVLAYPYTMLISIDGKPLGVTPDRIGYAHVGRTTL